MANKEDVAVIVAKISAAFPNFSPTAMTVAVYYEMLADIDMKELMVAANKLIAETGRVFAPSVGEIRGAIVEIRAQIAGVPSSYQAWQEVLTQISINGGDFGKPVWSNPIVEKTVKALGWRELRMSENQIADRSRFIQAYEQLCARAIKDEIEVPHVRGYIEQERKKVALGIEKITNLLEASK